ncbi:MAG: hypothetical protein JNJ88_14120 [Planctomycetes bacterium]|nr:hypothetical protein [Planctomycetota bacterium]
MTRTDSRWFGFPRRAVWLGAALLVGAWQAQSGDYEPAAPAWAIVCGAAGWLLICWGWAAADPADGRAGPNGQDPTTRAQRLLRGVLAAGAVTGALWLADLCLRGWAAGAPNSPIFAYASLPALAIAGIHAAVEQGSLLVRHPEGTVRIVLSPDKTALIPWIQSVATAALICAMESQRLWPRRFIIAAVGLLGFWLLRFQVLLLFYLEQEQILRRGSPSPLAIFYRIDVLIATLVIGSWIVERLTTRSTRSALEAPPPTARPRVSSGRLLPGAVVITLFLTALVGFYQDCGFRKAGRILVDDAHSSYWEPSARILDEQWYGDFSTYSFASAVEWLAGRYVVDVNMEGRLDEARLHGYDVLILKTPLKDYAPEEVSAIRRFVEAGGGLLAVGDHTNLLGSSARLNEILEPWGLEFRYDSVLQGVNHGFSQYRGSAFWRHPAVAHVERFEFMTSCSLRIRNGAKPVMVVRDSIREAADYANPSHFGAPITDPSMERGPMILSAAAEPGHGRVVAFTDSTVWSSFDLFKNGHEVHLLNSVEYLNRKSVVDGRILDAVFYLMALLSVGGAVLCARAGNRLSPAVVCACVCAAAGAAWIDEAATERAMVAPRLHTEVPEVRFQWEGGQAGFPPVLGATVDRDEVVFDTLFVATQRLGLRPQIAWKIARCFETGDDAQLEGTDRLPAALIILNPVVVPSDAYFRQLRSYLESGGNVMIIDRFASASSGALAAYLRALGLEGGLHVGEGAPHIDGPGFDPIPLPEPSMQAMVRTVGRGRLVLAADSELLSRKGIGHAFAVPWQSADRALRSWFTLLSKVLNLAPRERRLHGLIES